MLSPSPLLQKPALKTAPKPPSKPTEKSAPRAGAHLVTERLSDQLAALLRGLIDTGALRPGDRLPTEHQLAQTHGVSRTVVREAMHQVRSRNLVHVRQGSGVYVAAAPQNLPLAFDPRVLESVHSVVHVVEVRRVLEGEMAALAAERASRSQVADLRRALKAIDAAAASGHDGVAEDLSFHRLIGEATGNPQFSQLLAFLEQYLREGMRITRGNEARRVDFMDAVRREHHAIVDAIAERDPSTARRRATEHLVRAQQRLVEGGVIAAAKAQAQAQANERLTPSPRSARSRSPR